MHFVQIKCARRIQRFVRVAWARHKLKKFLRVVVSSVPQAVCPKLRAEVFDWCTCQVLVQKFVKRMKPRLNNFRRHKLMQAEAVTLAETKMQELGKLLTINEFWEGSAAHPHEERLRYVLGAV